MTHRLPSLPPGPPGKVLSTITWLAMTAPPTCPPPPVPMPGLSIVQAVACPPGFYRFLYDSVGEPWLWWSRRAMPTAELAAILADPRVEVQVLYRQGVPLGYAEIDRRRPTSVNLAYFGLMPEATGLKLGPWLLDWAQRRAWTTDGVRELRVNTCSLDHPAALGLYQRAGFRPIRREDTVIDDPRLSGLLPRHAAPRVPLVPLTEDVT